MFSFRGGTIKDRPQWKEAQKFFPREGKTSRLRV